jgi:TonB family protein
MLKRKSLTLTLVLLPVLILCQTLAYARAGSTEREQDGLAGPVRRVKTETAKITVKGGQPFEGPRAVLETTTYDQKGNRVDNAYFLSAGGSLTGKENYKYDERGNIVEMTLHDADGSLIAKEVYKYEFDAVGNWVKMTTAVAVIEGGKVTFEPSEVTYRTISYYLDEAVMAKLSQPAPAPPSAVVAAQPQPAGSAATPGAQTTSANAQKTSQTAAQTNPQAGAQSKTASPAPPAFEAAKQTAAARPARNMAAPLVVASLDKGSMADAGLSVSAAAGSGVAAPSAGPAVKSDGDAPAAPAAPVRTGPLKPVSGGILNGKALSLPPPMYPDVAKRSRASGLVEVEVVIDINGKVISAKAVRGPALLMQAAEMAARLARFTPTLLSGQPVRVVGLINYNFSLQQ